MKTFKTKDKESWIEVMGNGEGGAFVTVAHKEDKEDDERVMELTHRQALRLIRAVASAILEKY